MGLSGETVTAATTGRVREGQRRTPCRASAEGGPPDALFSVEKKVQVPVLGRGGEKATPRAADISEVSVRQSDLLGASRMFRRKFPPTHEDKKAKKLMDKIVKMRDASEKKQSHQDSGQASSQGTQKNPRAQAHDF